MKTLLEYYLLRHTILRYVLVFLLWPFFNQAQIANYVNNGGFEEMYSCDFPNIISKVKFWRGLDSLGNSPFVYSSCNGLNNVPLSSYTYQWPRNGNSYVAATVYCDNCPPNNSRIIFRNRLKSNLIIGKIYCVSFYVNISGNSSYGIDGFQAYFGGDDIDTITKTGIPLTFLNPQIQNPSGNIITDTLSWIKISGTFLANGNEKHLLIGNFKSNIVTNKLLINPNGLPTIATDACIDDVSCIDIDLPAFAGRDTSVVPGDSIYIGRESDVGIDEACQWYKLPTVITPATPAIDTIAGFWIKPVESCTYVVRQEICGNVKWDTVRVDMNPLGNVELEMLNDKLLLFPNPANDFIELKISNINLLKDFHSISIYNNLGQLIREEEITFREDRIIINTVSLTDGVYFIKIINSEKQSITKKLLIAR